MKIYKHNYIFFIRLTIKRRGDKNLYIPLVETTLDKTEEMLQAAIRSAAIDPLAKCNTTTIEMREATGGKNGAYRQLSFKGLSPQETFDLITEYINNKQKSKLTLEQAAEQYGELNGELGTMEPLSSAFAAGADWYKKSN